MSRAPEKFSCACAEISEKHGLDALEAVVNFASQRLHENASQRQGDKGDEGQEWADAEEEKQRAYREQDGIGAIHDGGAQQHADGVEVIGHPGHDVAGAVLVVIRSGLFFQLAEEVVAEVQFRCRGRCRSE